MQLVSQIQQMLRLPTGGGGFERTLNAADLFVGATVKSEALKRTKIGQLIVTAQTKFHWGFGQANLPANQGYMYVSIKDNQGTPAQIEGFVTLAVADANEWNIVNILRERTEVLRGDTADKNKKKALPEQGPWVTQDMHLLVYLEPDGDQTTNLISKANSILMLPTTCYPVAPR